MPEYNLEIKEVIEWRLLLPVKADTLEQARQLAWEQLQASGGLNPSDPRLQRSRISQQVLPADAPATATASDAAPPPPPAGPPQSMAAYGQLQMTDAVHRWIHEQPSEQIERELHVRRCLNRHISGEDGDLHPDDVQLNHEVRQDANGGRLMSVWSQPDLPQLWITTDAYGTSDAATTVLFPDDY